MFECRHLAFAPFAPEACANSRTIAHNHIASAHARVHQHTSARLRTNTRVTTRCTAAVYTCVRAHPHKRTHRRCMLMAQEAQGARKKELNGQSQVLRRFIF